MARLKSLGLSAVLGIGAIGVMVGLYFFLQDIIKSHDVIGMTLLIGATTVAVFWVGTRLLFGVLKQLERKVTALNNHITFLETQIVAGFNYQRDLDVARVKNKISGPRPPLSQIIEEKEKWDYNYTDSAESSAQEKTQ